MSGPVGHVARVIENNRKQDGGSALAEMANASYERLAYFSSR